MLPAHERALRRVVHTPPPPGMIGDCWIFPGCLQNGYGVIAISKGFRRFVHNVVYEALVGPMPDGLEPDHLCRRRACCNPAHLEPVTHRVNVLRGNGLAAQQARRTHCPQNHPYDEANTHRYRGRRYCRACNQERMRARHAKRRARANAHHTL